MRPRAPVALVAALLLVPAAAAADVGGRLDFAQRPALVGVLDATASKGSLDVGGATDGLEVSWASAEGRVEVTRYLLLANGYTRDDDPQPPPRPVELGEGGLVRIACRADCAVTLRASGEGWVGVGGEAAGSLLPEETPGLAIRGRTGRPVETPEPERVLPVHVGPGAEGLRLASGVARAGGRVELTVWDADVVLRAPDERSFETGRRVVDDKADGAVRTVEETLLRLTLEGAVVRTAPGAPARLEAESLQALLQGRASSTRASGWVEVDGERREVRAEDVLLEGALALDAKAAPRGTVSAAVSGEASLVVVGGQTLAAAVDAPLAASPGVAAAVAVGALVLLLLVGVPLYMRVTRAGVLEHPTRFSVYERIRASPGIHVSQLSRDVRVGRVVLQHHLRMLEAHRLVVSRASGRVLAYYLPEGVPGDEGLSAQMALKDVTRKGVLDAIAGEPGVTQRDLMDRLGLSQRLVSYHVHRLEELGLVVGDGGRPRRFRAVRPAEPAAST